MQVIQLNDGQHLRVVAYLYPSSKGGQNYTTKFKIVGSFHKGLSDFLQSYLLVEQVGSNAFGDVTPSFQANPMMHQAANQKLVDMLHHQSFIQVELAAVVDACVLYSTPPGLWSS